MDISDTISPSNAHPDSFQQAKCDCLRSCFWTKVAEWQGCHQLKVWILKLKRWSP